MPATDPSLTGVLALVGLPTPAAVAVAAAISALPGSAVAAITSGAINGATVGQTTPAAVKTSNLAATYTDNSGTPGNTTINTPRGRAAIAASSATCTVTNALVTAASTILGCNLATLDATLTSILTVVPAAGSFTVTGNAAATGNPKFDFVVVN